MDPKDDEVHVFGFDLDPGVIFVSVRATAVISCMKSPLDVSALTY